MEEPIYLNSIALDQICGLCDGRGEYYNPDYERWALAYYDGDPECGPEPADHLTCEECEGRGLFLTFAGEELLRFLKRYRNL